MFLPLPFRSWKPLPIVCFLSSSIFSARMTVVTASCSTKMVRPRLCKIHFNFYHIPCKCLKSNSHSPKSHNFQYISPTSIQYCWQTWAMVVWRSFWWSSAHATNFGGLKMAEQQALGFAALWSGRLFASWFAHRVIPLTEWRALEMWRVWDSCKFWWMVISVGMKCFPSF